jgi:hypothetical protein
MTPTLAVRVALLWRWAISVSVFLAPASYPKAEKLIERLYREGA